MIYFNVSESSFFFREREAQCPPPTGVERQLYTEFSAVPHSFTPVVGGSGRELLKDCVGIDSVLLY